MKLLQFINKYKLSDSITIDIIPVKHPETGAKIYIISHWFSGIWYRKQPGQKEGQMWPVEYYDEIGNLEVHKDAKKELKGLIK